MTARQRWHVPMRGRDPDEEHRASTPLELLFDLCFVVAVAQAGIALHHQLADGHVLDGGIYFLMVFFAIWWAWMNFTWFASAFDTDDVLYRLLTFVQIAGVLVIAAGVPRAFEGFDYTMITVGYVVMRVGLVAQWLRVAVEHPDLQQTALRFAIGVGVLQLGWITRLFLPRELAIGLFAPLVALELLVPAWAERTGHPTPWHPRHIAERYGLFTIIVLGEVILAATTAIQEAITASGLSVDLVVLAFGGLLLVGAMWWAYFKHDTARDLGSGSAFLWGYGHYAIFASVAAVGAGLQVTADLTHQAAEISPTVASLAVAVPVAAYLLAAWLVAPGSRSVAMLARVGIAAVLVTSAAALLGGSSPSLAVLAMGVVVAGLVAASVLRAARAQAPAYVEA